MPSRKSVAVSESSDASQQSVSRKAGTSDKEPVGLVEEGRRGRRGGRRERTTERVAQRGTTRVVVPAWLPSLEWWAIAAMRAPMQSNEGEGGGRQGGVRRPDAYYAFSLSLSSSLCINRGTIANPESGVGSRPGRHQILSFPLQLAPRWPCARRKSTHSSRLLRFFS